MSGYTSTPAICPHCNYGHVGTCPRIKAIEYHPDGTVKRIEFHEPQPITGVSLGNHPDVNPTFR